MDTPVTDKEAIFHQQIEPLLDQIIDICLKHKIAMLNTMVLSEEEDGHKLCHTFLAGPEFGTPVPALAIANYLIKERSELGMANVIDTVLGASAATRHMPTNGKVH